MKLSSAFGLLFLALVNVPASGTSAAPVVASVGGTADDRKFDAMVAQAKDAMLSSPAQAEAIGRAAEEFSKTAPTLSNRVIAIATAEWLEGEAYIRQNKIDMAAPYISRALQKAISYRKITPLLGNILLSKGWISTSKPDVAQALDDYQRAYRVFQTVNDRRNRSIALLSIASLYKEAKDYDNAEKYYKQALDDVASDPKMLVAIYNNRGNVQKEAAKYEGAIEQFKQALLIARSLKSPSLEAQVLRNLARAQLGAGQVSDADASIRRGIQLARASGDPSAEEQFWNVAALAAFEEGRIGEARSLIGRVFAGLDLTQTRLSFRESHETAFKIYQRAGDQKLALAHLMALKRLDDQATQLAASTNTSLMAAKFDYANQDLKIAQLRRAEAQRSLELERSRARFQRILFAGSAIAALIVFGMLGFGIVTLRRSRNEVRAANIDLAASNSALEKALAAKTEFLATTSHEIRTPLNGILGMTQVMLNDARLSAETRDRIGVVHGAGVTMRALVDDILDVAKMETGNMTIEEAPFDLSAMLTDMARMWQDQATTKGIAFDMQADDCPRLIIGDAARLRQIVFNLMSNALKFTKAGRITLSAAVSGERLSIAVSDTGIGIPAEKQELIFESFRQGDAGTTRQFGGTGLGLSICRNLARAMGGDVTVSSQPGEGSTFTLDIPLVLAPQIARPTEAISDGLALLVVDRNPITRSMLKALLAPRAGEVAAAGTMSEALALLGNQPVARIMIDGAVLLEAADDASGGAIPDELLQLATSHGAGIILLLAADHPLHEATVPAPVERVITKPIAGAALVEMLYPSAGMGEDKASGLVSQAA